SSAAMAMSGGHHRGLRLPGTELADVMSLEESRRREVQADCLSFDRDRLLGRPEVLGQRSP
ncbi:hypothetical protein, partial [Streptomyces scabiei]|uniref:hypothetical protein n=1 Tax=Streptomyces scabiei TaxID=1930 RepID=UPI001C4F3FCA